MRDSENDASVHWYYMADEKQQGPVTLSRLRQMARQGTISRGTAVRKGTSEDWMTAGEVEGLHAQIRERAAEPQAAEEPVVQKPPDTHRIGDFVDSAGGLLSGMARAVTDRFDLFRTIVAWLILIGTLVGLLRSTVDWDSLAWKSEADPMETVESLWDELRTHRTKQSGDTVWSEFSTRGLEQLKPVVARLEKKAGASDRISQFLLWSARDCLPRMFDDARKEASPTENRLAEYLKNIRLLNEGKAIYVENRRGRRPRVVSDSGFMTRFRQDPVNGYVLVLMVIVIFSVIVWFIRRNRHEKNSGETNPPT